MTEFKVGDKVKIKEAMWTKLSRNKYGFSKDEYEIVSTVFGEGTYSSLNFYGKKGRYDAAYFELVEQEKVKNKFSVGDRVISIKNTPEVPEGFIGYVQHVATDDNYDYAVENLGVPEYFKEDELELLSAAKQDFKDIKIPHDSVGLSFDDPKMKLTPADFKGIVKPDVINSPKHYAVFESVEAIQVIASSMTQDQFYGYCFGNILKYRLRAGGKDDVMQELGKADRYQGLYTENKHLCKEGK